MEAPHGVGQLEIRRSARLISIPRNASQLKATQPTFVKAPRGTKPSTGYVYQVLSASTEKLEDHEDRPDGPVGEREIPDGHKDVEKTQANHRDQRGGSKGRKRAATSEAPGSSRRLQNPIHLASASDFPPDHWAEPTSDGLLGVPPIVHDPHPLPESPIQIDPPTPTRSKRAVDDNPESSPIARNPLLQRDPQTPNRSPGRRQFITSRTRDADVAWAMADGPLPIDENFRAPGFVPSLAVGGITYNVTSPKERNHKHATHTPPRGKAAHTSTNTRIYPFSNPIHQNPMSPNLQIPPKLHHTRSDGKSTEPHSNPPYPSTSIAPHGVRSAEELGEYYKPNNITPT